MPRIPVNPVMLKTRPSLICMVAWLGLSYIHATEDDFTGNMDNTGVSFPNAAQAQHAENIATQAARQHPDVSEGLAQAKTSKNPEDIEIV